MNRELLLTQIKQAVQAIEPDAEIILFGSRARGDAQPDWDVLILVDGVVDMKRTDTIRHKLHTKRCRCIKTLSKKEFEYENYMD